MRLGSHYIPGYSQDSNRAGVGAILGFGGGVGEGRLRLRPQMLGFHTKIYDLLDYLHLSACSLGYFHANIDVRTKDRDEAITRATDIRC